MERLHAGGAAGARRSRRRPKPGGDLDVIEARTRSGQTGAAWQREALRGAGGDVFPP